MPRRNGPAVLIGSKPAEGSETLARMGIPFIWIVDPADDPPVTANGATEVVQAPFKSDPMSVLDILLPETVCAVFSFTELGSLPAALLSEALGLPTVPVRAVVRTRNKLHMRRALGASLPQPAFGVIGRDDPTEADFPVVAKPAQGSGSRNVEYVPDVATYQERAASLSGYMWEHYITGDEYSVEAVSFDGDHKILGITAKQTNGQPYFLESGHEVPALLAPEVEQQILNCVVRCLDALEITVGASHTEVKVEDGRAMLIETHTRGGGDRIPLLTRLVSGADQFELAVQSVLPWARARPTAPEYKHAAVHYFPWEGVTVHSVEGLEDCRTANGVVEAVVDVRSGDQVPIWRYSHERPGHVVVGGDDLDGVRRRIAEAAALVRPQFH